MRKQMKENVLQLLEAIQGAQGKILTLQEMAECLKVLEECQQAAIVAGETLEAEVQDSEKLVQSLEHYCEAVFQMAQSMNQEPTSKISAAKLMEAGELLRQVSNQVEAMETTWRVVFLPYKAEMWDSLESIWLACKQDERMECAVVAIPYYEFNAKLEKWEYRYDGEKFPSHVPITPYQDYPLEQMCPDAAFVHNPYDDRNYVTSVHPNYYSFNLKKFVGKLFYVPYYVTPGWIEENHLALSVYNHMDYMIAQSTYAKSCFEGLPHYEKVLPLGSPKFDRLIHQCQRGVKMPEQWKEMLTGKKVLLLNTSIGDLLNFNEYLFRKLNYLFKLIQEQNQVALIWRPHPLLEATVHSMRPNLEKQFQELVWNYQEEKIGVYDQTSDVSTSIALSDAYMDSGLSSVANLAAAAGKPIYCMNYFYFQEVTEEEHHTPYLIDMQKIGNQLWFTTEQSTLLYMDLSDWKMRYGGRIPGNGKWILQTNGIVTDGETIFFSPMYTHQPISYDIQQKKFQRLFPGEYKQELKCSQIFCYQDKVVYLPGTVGSLMIYHKSTGAWSFEGECIEALWKGKDHQQWMTLTGYYSICKGIAWVTSIYTNRILQIDLEQEVFQVVELGEATMSFGCVQADCEGLWLTETQTGAIIRWDAKSGALESYAPPQELHSRVFDKGKTSFYAAMHDMGDCFIMVPNFANGLVKFDKISKEAKLMLPELFQKEQASNGYQPECHGVARIIQGKIDDRYILIQRNYDRNLILVDVAEESYQILKAGLSEEEFEKMLEGSDGFEKAGKEYNFFRRESEIFTLQQFVEDLAEGKLEAVRERQMNALTSMAANLDGSCGEKVHEMLREILGKCE